MGRGVGRGRHRHADPYGFTKALGSEGLGTSDLVLPATRQFLDAESPWANLDGLQLPGGALERPLHDGGATECRREDLMNKAGHSRGREASAGLEWTAMPSSEMTPELRRDLRILRRREQLDPKRFYKATGNRRDHKSGGRRLESEMVQEGRIVAGAHEFYSARLPRKERGQYFIDDLLRDQEFRSRITRRFNEIQSQRVRPPRKKWEKHAKFHKKTKNVKKQSNP